jgi:hypothetical protein
LNNYDYSPVKIYEYLERLDQLPQATNIIVLILNEIYTYKYYADFLINLRKKFINLSAIYLLDSTDLTIRKDYPTFKNLLYDEKNNFKPLIFYVKNAKQLNKKLQRSVLLYYKNEIWPLFLLYLMINSFYMGSEILELTNRAPWLFIPSIIAPVISYVASCQNGRTTAGYLKKSHNISGSNIKSEVIINKSDLIFILPMLLHILYLIELKMTSNLSLKTALMHRVYIFGFVLFLTRVIKKFEDERFVYTILRNNNIFQALPAQ